MLLRSNTDTHTPHENFLTLMSVKTFSQTEFNDVKSRPWWFCFLKLDIYIILFSNFFQTNVIFPVYPCLSMISSRTPQIWLSLPLCSASPMISSGTFSSFWWTTAHPAHLSPQMLRFASHTKRTNIMSSHVISWSQN